MGHPYSMERLRVSVDRQFSALIHGPSKAGKSSLSFTAPFPLACLDAEGSTKFIKTAGFKSAVPARKIDWNPITEKAPVHDGSWDVAVVKVPDWLTMKTFRDRIKLEPHPFRSLSLDSVTEIQRKCKSSLERRMNMQQQDWGVLLAEMDDLIRGLRDLTLVADNPLQVAVFIAETVMKDGKWRPNMQGAISTSMPYWVDVCGYLDQRELTDGTTQTELTASKHPLYEAGERVQGVLPKVIANANINDIIHYIYS